MEAPALRVHEGPDEHATFGGSSSISISSSGSSDKSMLLPAGRETGDDLENQHGYTRESRREVHKNMAGCGCRQKG